MSTSFSLMSDTDQESTIALRFWGGDEDGCTVRFAFPEVLLMHLKDVELVGDNGETITVGQLHDSTNSQDFLRDDNSIDQHLNFGTHGAREQARLMWEATA
mgnify:CR=1 FL=1|jgi:hypothetical protein